MCNSHHVIKVRESGSRDMWNKILAEGGEEETEEDMVGRRGRGFEEDGEQCLEKESTGQKWMGNNSDAGFDPTYDANDDYGYGDDDQYICIINCVHD